MSTSQIRQLGIVDEESEPVSLIAAAAGGDVRAFERLYTRFAPVLEHLFKSTWHDEFDLCDSVVRGTELTTTRS